MRRGLLGLLVVLVPVLANAGEPQKRGTFGYSFVPYTKHASPPRYAPRVVPTPDPLSVCGLACKRTEERSWGFGCLRFSKKTESVETPHYRSRSTQMFGVECRDERIDVDGLRVRAKTLSVLGIGVPWITAERTFECCAPTSPLAIRF